jgi:hypothetical protein
VKQVVEQFRAPNAIEPGPNASLLGFLLVNLQQFLAEMARRVNTTAPKDGSEPTQMVSYSSVDLTVGGDLDDGDPGYYAVVRCNVTGANRTLSGLVDGLAQEGVGGRIVSLMNVGTGGFDLIVAHEDAGSAEGNRFKLPGAADINIADEEVKRFWYDPTTLKWRMLS